MKAPFCLYELNRIAQRSWLVAFCFFEIVARASTASLAAAIIFISVASEANSEEDWQTGAAVKSAAQNGVVKILYVKQRGRIVTTQSGAGSIINSNGVVVTNRHVIEGAKCSELTATTFDGKTYRCAEIINSFKNPDFAVIRFDFPVGAIKTIIPFAPDDPVAGETVHALGHPEWSEWVITRGVISANPYIFNQAYLMHDASINHGNSGGPLLNENGQMVAMNTFASGGRYQNMNLSVRGELMKSLLNQMDIAFSTNILVISPQQRIEELNRQLKQRADVAERIALSETSKNRVIDAQRTAGVAPVSSEPAPKATETANISTQISRLGYFLIAADAEGGIAYGQIGSRGSTAKDKSAELLSYGAVSATIGVRPFAAGGNSLLLGVTSRVGGLSTSAAKNIYLEQYRADYSYIGRRVNAKNVPLSADGANFEEGKGSPFSEYLMTAGLCEWLEIGWGTGIQHFSFSDDAGDLKSIQAFYHVSSVKFMVGAPFTFSLGASYLYSGLYQRPSVRYDAALGYSLSL